MSQHLAPVVRKNCLLVGQILEQIPAPSWAAFCLAWPAGERDRKRERDRGVEGRTGTNTEGSVTTTWSDGSNMNNSCNKTIKALIVIIELAMVDVGLHHCSGSCNVSWEPVKWESLRTWEKIWSYYHAVKIWDVSANRGWGTVEEERSGLRDIPQQYKPMAA